MHPILAIDHGDSRIGLAASDLLGIAVHPAGTVYAKEVDPLEAVAEVIRQRQVVTIVIGLPLHMDGSEGKAAQKVRSFGKKIKALFPDLPLHFTDERLTTVAASEKLAASGKKGRDQKAIIDQAAAMEILESFLDEHQLQDFD